MCVREIPYTFIFIETGNTLRVFDSQGSLCVFKVPRLLKELRNYSTALVYVISAKAKASPDY